jgi:hypothetical protein
MMLLMLIMTVFIMTPWVDALRVVSDEQMLGAKVTNTRSLAPSFLNVM